MFRGDNCEEKYRKDSNFFEEIVVNFFSGSIAILEQKVGSLIERQERRIRKNVILLAVFLVGALYVLNAMAIFISEYLKTGNWLGYGLVGIVLIIISFILKK
ncbi:MAG: hypothetical protein ACD_15C00151G0018 [uncultured bacterium]|nr:MAG: hypothetical protein ACD_15C00151G0018 [uncultured bacterium]HCU70932.1 hypothetical protein [Candidatus Moranbacteria bacterium]